MIKNITGFDIDKVDTVFLDLDGTVSKSGTSCKNGVKYMFDKIGHKPVSGAELNMFIGPTVKVHLREEYGFSEEDAAAAAPRLLFGTPETEIDAVLTLSPREAEVNPARSWKSKSTQPTRKPRHV